MRDDEVLTRLRESASILDYVCATEPAFRSRSTDALRVAELRRGQVVLGAHELNLRDGPESLRVSLADADRSVQLEGNSLRFLDVLRRAGDVSCDRGLWLSYVRGWAADSTEQDTAAWSFTSAGFRALVLAAGLRHFWPDISTRPIDVQTLLESHAEMFLSSIRSGRVLLLREKLLRGAGSMAEMRSGQILTSQLLCEFQKTFLPTGVAPGGGIAVTEEQTRWWNGLLSALGAAAGFDPGADSSGSELTLEQLRVHATRPTGLVHQGGLWHPDDSWARRVPASAAERYVATGSDSGQAPNELTFRDAAGWLFARSGWGETERDVQDESHFSLRFGPLESASRHQDNTSLTFTSRGVSWIDDPAIQDVSEAAQKVWGRRDHHSCVEMSARYRTHSHAELTRAQETEQCFEYEVRDRAYLPTTLTRRVAYSRSGDYLVVVDQIRSKDLHTASQYWMIPPGCTVTRQTNGLLLTSGTEVCHMQWLNVPAPEVILEHCEAPDGLVWTRASVRSEALSTRIIVVLVPASAAEDVSVQRRGMTDGDMSILVHRPRHSEQMVCTKEATGTGSVDDSPESLAERVRNAALTGGLSPEAERQQRLAVRSCIHRIKEQVWASGGTAEARRIALDDLLEVSREFDVRGLRDHGLGAALIDMASEDLGGQIAGHALVTGRKRSPVISWNAAKPLVHPFYQVAVRSFCEISDDIAEFPERQILSFDLGQLVLPLLLSRKSAGDTLHVMFHGATDRTRNSMPRFERLRSVEANVPGPSLFVSDPSLDLDANQILTWYMGNEELNLHEFMAKEIQLLARRLGCQRILYIGNSGGGFAALQTASYTPNSGVVAFNPQIQVEQYIPRVARSAQEIVFGRSSVAEDPLYSSRVDLIQRYSEIGFERRVYFIQNTGDEMHHDRHFIPFREAFNASGNSSNLRAVTPYLGPGHRVPPPEEYMAMVSEGARFVFGE